MIDLHIHTTCSDGQFSPTETIRMAREAGITAVAITDHDTVSGVAAAAQAAKTYNMQFFSGIEISAQWQTEMHILGYGMESTHAGLLQFCENSQKNRANRATHILQYLKSCGITITEEDVRQCNNGKISGRVHFARALTQKGYATSVQDAFEKYLTTPTYYAKVERPKPSPEKAIHMLRNAGGVAVLAHPHQLHLEEAALDTLLAQLKAWGLQGIEAYYSRHTKAQTEQYLHLAKRHELLVTCGSDFHGPAIKPDINLGSGIENNLCVTDQTIPNTLALKIQNNQI